MTRDDRTMRSTWAPMALLVLALPFIMGTIQNGTGRLTVVVVGIILTPMIALQAWSQGRGLGIVARAVGTTVPDEARETIAAIARATYSLCWAVTVQNVAILLAIRSDWIRIADQRPESPWFAAGLVAASLLILAGVTPRLVRAAIALSPVAMLTLAGYGYVDILAVSTWETMFATVCAVVMIGVQSKEQFEISIALARRVAAADRAGRDADAPGDVRAEFVRTA